MKDIVIKKEISKRSNYWLFLNGTWESDPHLGLCWVNLGWPLGIHQAALSLPFNQQDKGRKYDKKCVGWDKEREISDQFAIMGKTD